MFKPKPAKKEYEHSMLPKNRKEVFFDVLKLNWVGDLIDEYSTISEIAEKLGEALTVAFGADALDKGDSSGEK